MRKIEFRILAPTRFPPDAKVAHIHTPLPVFLGVGYFLFMLILLTGNVTPFANNMVRCLQGLSRSRQVHLAVYLRLPFDVLVAASVVVFASLHSS